MYKYSSNNMMDVKIVVIVSNIFKKLSKSKGNAYISTISIVYMKRADPEKFSTGVQGIIFFSRVSRAYIQEFYYVNLIICIFPAPPRRGRSGVHEISLSLSPSPSLNRIISYWTNKFYKCLCILKRLINRKYTPFLPR